MKSRTIVFCSICCAMRSALPEPRKAAAPAIAALARFFLNGKPVNSCLVLSGELDGADIVTIEGLKIGPELHPIQKAFIQDGGAQCGYCTPGMLMMSKALLDENPNPTEEEIRYALSGNLCRCTGYAKIIQAVQDAAADDSRNKRCVIQRQRLERFELLERLEHVLGEKRWRNSRSSANP